MATSSLEDDFKSRIRKTFRVRFRDSIIPSYVIPYLRCLSKCEEDTVLAREKQFGPTLAADELFELLLRRSDWVEDLIRALRDPGVRHTALAQEIEDYITEVPMRYNVCEMKDKYGTVCCNGHCDSQMLYSQTHDEEEKNIENTTNGNSDGYLRIKQETTPKDLATQNQPLQSREYHTDEQKKQDEEDESNMNVRSTAESEEDLELRRKRLKLQIMEKMWSYVKKLEDVPLVLEYIDRAELQLRSVDKGSLLFTVKVKNLEDLERLRDLVRYGGMKTILDQEVIGKNMEEFRSLAKSQNIELESIESELFLHEADLYRCKSLLITKRHEEAARACMEGLVMPNFKDQIDVIKQKRLKELFPPCCLYILEDPFVQNRLSDFLQFHDVDEAITRKLKPLTDELEVIRLSTNMQITGPPPLVNNLCEMILTSRKLLAMFFEWVIKRLTEILNEMNFEDLQNLIQIGAMMLMTDIFAISNETVKEGTLAEIPHPFTLRKSQGFFKDFPTIKTEELSSASAYTKAVDHLVSKGILRVVSGKYEFCSKLLRDTVLSHIIETHNISAEIDVNKYDYLPVTLGLFCQDEEQNEKVLNGCSNEQLYCYMLTAFHTDYSQLVAKLEDVDDQFRAEWSPTKNASLYRCWTYFLCCQIPIVWEKPTIFSNKTLVTIQLSEDSAFGMLPVRAFIVPIETLIRYYESDALTRDNIKIDLSLNMSDVDVNSDRLTHILNFISVSELTSKLALQRCIVTPRALGTAFMTGNFANIKHLDLSETVLNLDMSKPLGLSFMPKLQTVDLHSCKLHDNGIKNVAQEFRVLQNLKEINVSNNAISSAGLQELANEMTSNHGITALRVHNNDFGPDGALILAGWLRRLCLLEILNISNCNVKDVGIQHISKSIVSKVITQMSMRDNSITKFGSENFFKTMARKPTLEHLDYGRNRIFDPYEYSLGNGTKSHPIYFSAFIHGATYWSHLSIWDCNLGAQRVFQDYENLRGLKHLVYLCLQSNHIDDAFAVDVGSCLKEHCDFIRHVNLRHNIIGNTGATSVADGVANKTYLEELLIDKNQIEEDGIRRLLIVTLQIKHGFKLDASCNNIARPNIDRLAIEQSLQIHEQLEETISGKGSIRLYVPADSQFETEIFL